MQGHFSPGGTDRRHDHQETVISTGKHFENKQGGAVGREGPLAEGAKGNS